MNRMRLCCLRAVPSTQVCRSHSDGAADAGDSGERTPVIRADVLDAVDAEVPPRLHQFSDELKDGDGRSGVQSNST
jgi:hypothetical protein